MSKLLYILIPLSLLIQGPSVVAQNLRYDSLAQNQSNSRALLEQLDNSSEISDIQLLEPL